MKLTQALLGEHGALYAMFDHVEEHVLRVGSEPAMRAAAALVADALISHARMEDDLLFPAMEAAQPGIPPLRVMKDQHAEVDALLLSIPGCRGADDIAGKLARAMELTREHFAREESVLFPMAEQVLGEVELRRLAQQWARMRSVHLA